VALAAQLMVIGPLLVAGALMLAGVGGGNSTLAIKWL
jgi:hypothetical protein